VVYIDTNVFNYTEANNRTKELDDNNVFSRGGKDSCRWIVMYMICLSIYPQCNISTKALVPPCMEDCINYSEDCRTVIAALNIFATMFNNPLDKKLVLNCSAPFRAFNSVSVDAENCYDFNCKLSLSTVVLNSRD